MTDILTNPARLHVLVAQPAVRDAPRGVAHRVRLCVVRCRPVQPLPQVAEVQPHLCVTDAHTDAQKMFVRESSPSARRLPARARPREFVIQQQDSAPAGNA